MENILIALLLISGLSNVILIALLLLSQRRLAYAEYLLSLAIGVIDRTTTGGEQ